MPDSFITMSSGVLRPSERQLQIMSNQETRSSEECPSSQYRVRRDSGYVHVAVKFDRSSVPKLIDRPYLRSFGTGSMSMSEEQIIEESTPAPIVEEEETSIPEVLQESDVDHFQTVKDEEIPTEPSLDLQEKEVVPQIIETLEINEVPEFVEHQEAHEPEMIEENEQSTLESHKIYEEPEMEKKEQEVVVEKLSEVRIASPPMSPSGDTENCAPIEVLNPKKLDTNVWPPPASAVILDAKPKVTSEEILPRKKINDLIAKFNNGHIENDSLKKELDYKSEYGATKSVGKIQNNVFH